MNRKLMSWTLRNISAPVYEFTPPMDMRCAIENVRDLPPMPCNVVDILHLIVSSDVDCIKLAEIVERDPFITAQVIRSASSALYGFRGKICSVQDSIVRILGYDFVVSLVLGMSMLDKLNAPMQGPIGVKSFWVHALASVSLMRALVTKMPEEIRPDTSELYSVAMLHNIGYPILGHLFREEFNYVNDVIIANANLSVFNLESFTLGATHCELGVWLMGAWNMPDVILDVTYHHHNPAYRGSNYILNLMTYLNDHLLGSLGIGDAINQSLPEEVLHALGLDTTVCDEAIAHIATQIDGLAAIADGFV